MLVFSLMLMLVIGSVALVAVGSDFSSEIQMKEEEVIRGSGTRDDPVMIYDVDDLQDMNLSLSGHYALANDIDASATAGWNDGAGFVPIGVRNDEFTGSFDGHNHTITGLYINRTDDNVGLFGYLDSPATVSNVGLVDADVTGRDNTGALVGFHEGAIDNSYATGMVNGNRYVGGLIGASETGSVSNSHASVDVTGNEGIGGLAGYKWGGSFTNCYATGDVTGNAGIGGLIGYHYLGTVSGSYATGDVSSDGNAGGLMASHGGRVSESYSTGNVNGGHYTGGLVGYNYGTVSECYSTSETDGENYVGGLVGWNGAAVVEDSYAVGNVNGVSHIGGLVGWNYYSSVENSYSIGQVSGTSEVGGLVGYNEVASVDNSFWDVDTSGLNESDGGVGETTEEMMFNATFSNEGWDIGQVPDTDTRDTDHIWNIVETETYPFFSWQEDIYTPVKYELTINSTDGGSVTDPGEATYMYDHGTVVDIVATSDANYHFVQWTGDIDTIADANSATTTIIMNDDYGITAVFSEDETDEDTFELTVYIHGSGSVSITPDQDEYTDGTDVTIIATADPGWEFSHWTGDHPDGESEESEITIVMDENKTLTANFVILSYELTVTVDGNGEVTRSPDQAEYDHGTAVTLTAVPDVDWVFVEWTGDVTGTEDEVTITMVDDHSVTAVFQERVDTYTLTIEVNGDGATDPAKGTHTYDEGTSVTVTATPSTGWEFVGWSGDGTGTSLSITVTMDSDKTVTATFETDEDTFELSISSTDGGTVTTPGEGLFNRIEGAVVPLVAVADNGYEFVEWTGDTDTIDDTGSATTSITMNDDYSITANFAIVEHDLTIDSTDGGSVSEPGEGIYQYNYGTVVDLVATPDAGFHFVEWIGDVDTISNVTSATTTITVNGDHEITAEFMEDVEEEDTFELTINIEGSGSVSITPDLEVYADGTDVTIIATADSGWEFSHWTGDHPAGESDEIEITLVMDDDKTLTAHFIEITDDTDDDESTTASDLLSDYWWLLLLLIIVIVVVLIMVMKKGSGKEPESMEEPSYIDQDPMEQPSEFTDEPLDQPLDSEDYLDLDDDLNG